MSAITVSDAHQLTLLPRIGGPARGSTYGDHHVENGTHSSAPLDRLAASSDRPVASITAAPSGYEGEGFPVHRAFAGVDLTLLDPFVHLDEMGAVEYAPGEPKGTPWHPHRGFETVTYIVDGTFDHQDSHGGGGRITDGDTQWMTAGSGLLHIEAPPESLVLTGGLFHGFQLWVNLPAASKMIAPRYQDLRAGSVGLATSASGASLVRVIAGALPVLGDAGEVSGPGSTYTPIVMAHATVAPGDELVLPWRPDFNALAYVVSGRGSVGAERRPISGGHLAVFGGPGSGAAIRLGADERQDERHAAGLEVLLLGGAPLREPVAWGGPFVMNTRAEVVQAFEDFRAGRLGQIPG